jgi:hypothetical protein
MHRHTASVSDVLAEERVEALQVAGLDAVRDQGGYAEVLP